MADPAARQRGSARPDLDRAEEQVLALLATFHPDGLSDQDLRDILQGHSGPCEAADRLVELGLAVKPDRDVEHWRATAAGIAADKRH